MKIKLKFKTTEKVLLKFLTITLFFLGIIGNQAQAATVYFNTVYQGVGSYGEETSSITLAANKITGSNFSFTDGANGKYFASGNNESGTFKYYDSAGVLHSIPGIISRQRKNGSTTIAAYFTSGSTAYLFIIPSNESSFTGGVNYNTASNPITAVLNTVVDATPTIVVSSYLLTAFSTCQNIASTAQSFTVSGINLVANITITAPTGFEVSKTSATASFGSSVSLVPTSGTVPSTTIWVRLAAGAAGSYGPDIVISSSTNSNTLQTTVSGTVNANTAISTQPSTGSQTLCLNASASPLSVSATGIALTYQWYSNTTSSNTGGTLVSDATASTYTPLTSSSGTKYYYVIVSGGCGPAITSSVSGAITVNAASVGGTVSGGTSVCTGSNSTTLTLSGNVGSVLRWESSSTTAFSSPVTIANTTTSLTITNLSTTTYYRAVVSNAGCTASNSSYATLTVTSPPTTSVAGVDQTLCVGNSATLNANSPSVGTGIWSVVSGPNLNSGQFSNTASSTSTFSPTLAGTYILRWTISSGACAASTSELTITVSTVNTISVQPSTSPQTVCLSGSPSALSITGTTTGLNYNWYSNTTNANSGGILVATHLALSGSTDTYTPSALVAGTLYYYVIVSDNSGCGQYSTVSGAITVSAVPTTAAAGADQIGSTTCGLTVVTLAANTPSVGTGVWSIVSGSGGSFADSTNPLSTFSGTAGATYVLRWTISNTPCNESSDELSVTFNIAPTTAAAGADQINSATCGLTVVTLAANTPSVGTGVWSIVSGSGGSFAVSTNPLSTFSGTAGVTYVLRWTTSNGSCTSIDEVSVLFNVAPTAANAGLNSNILNSGNLSANTPTTGTGSWSIVSGSGGSIGTASSPTSTFSGTLGSTYTLRWTTVNGACTSTDDVDITIVDVAPSSLSYTTPNTFIQGELISPLFPSVSGGLVISFSISPVLPTGLSLDISSGKISGTSTVTNPATTYTVTATNTGGNTTTTLSIAVIDLPPVITGPGSATGLTSVKSIPENTTAVHTFTANEAVTWSKTGGADQAKFTLDAATGVISFTTAPDYEVPTDNGSDNTYIVILTATDGSANTTSQTLTVTVTNVDDTPPVITGPGSATGLTSVKSIPENTTAVHTFTANEAVTWSKTGGADQSKFTLDAATGVISFTTAPDYEVPTDNDANNTYIVILTATDGSANTTSQTLTVTVTNVDDTPPVITGPGSATGLTSVKSIPENTTAVHTFTANEAVTWSKTGGADQAKFTLDAATGVISFTTAPDYEVPTDNDANNTYIVILTATDGSANTTSQTLTVTVTNVDDTAPVITGPGSATGLTSVKSIPENTTAVHTFTANEAVTWSKTGGADQAKFTLDAATGVISFTTAPDYEVPTDNGSDNTYIVILTATDGSANTTSQTLTVTVTNVDDTAPVITGPGSATGLTSVKSIPENTTAVHTFTANEAVTWSKTGGADQAKFTLDAATGVISFTTAPDYEVPTDNGSDNTYIVILTATDGSANTTSQTLTVTVTNVDDTPPVITGPGSATGLTSVKSIPENTTAVHTFTANEAVTWSKTGGADQSKFTLDAATGVISFTTAPDYEVPTDNDANNTYIVILTATDGSANTTSQTLTVTVTNVDDTAPVITGPGSTTGLTSVKSIPENTTAVHTFTANEAVTWSKTGGADQAKFTLDAATGVISFTTAPDYEVPTDNDANNTYIVILTATDGSANTTSQTLTVTVTNVDDTPPVITGPGSTTGLTSVKSIPENTTAVHTFTANEAVTWSKTGGADQAKFTLDAATGVISFTTAPDYEVPTDNGSDNTYIVILTATDGSANTTSQTLTVTVTNVDDTLLSSLSYSPNNQSVRLNSPITPMNPISTGGAVISYSISPNLPAGLNINTATGIVSGTLSAPQIGSQLFTIRATNTSGSTTATITLLYHNAPVNIALSKTVIFESNAIGVIIGSLSTTDPDPSDTHTYSLVSGQGSIDNSSFSISGNSLKATTIFEYATKNSYSIRVRTTDTYGLSFEKNFSITISQKPVVTGTGYTLNAGASLPSIISTSISKGYSSQLNVRGINLLAYSWSPSIGLNTTNLANPVASPNQTTTYTVKVSDTYGNSTEAYFTVIVEIDYNITPSNVITPNGDGKNDKWVIGNLYSYPNNQILIFDKAGRLLIEKNNYQNDWDGTLNGIPLKEDTYYYVIILGKGIAPKKGFITIVHK